MRGNPVPALNDVTIAVGECDEAFCAWARVATTLQEMSARPAPTPSTQPASDASMSLDQVDWDLILKATGSTPGGRTRRGAAPIDFDPAPRPATAPEDLTPRARELLAKSRQA